MIVLNKFVSYIVSTESDRKLHGMTSKRGARISEYWTRTRSYREYLDCWSDLTATSQALTSPGRSLGLALRLELVFPNTRSADTGP
jgi:hypothetical protein